MQSRMRRWVLQLSFMLLLSNAAIGQNGNIRYHHCFYDEIHRNTARYHLTTEEADSYLEDETVFSIPSSWPVDYLRVKFFAHDLQESKTNYCTSAGAKVKDVRGVEVQCEQEDILTEQKKKDLLQIVRSAVNMHTARLKVRRLKKPIKVPQLSGPLCQLFAVPEKHKTNGVQDADMVLYVSSRPSSKEEMFAAGAPCATLYNWRPVVGVLIYTTRRIAPTAYSVRVAAHEIAHMLGFTYEIIKKRIVNQMKNTSRRGKHNLNEVHSKNVVKFLKMHYDCGAPWGIELEDERGALTVPSRSHWKRRNALEELMAGIVTAGFYTYLTLALFEDLGFYRADYSKSEQMEWGTGGGCDFINKKCVGDGKDNSRFFCSDKDSKAWRCAPGGRGMGICSNTIRNDQMPFEYRYFWEYSWGRAYYQYYTGEEGLMTDKCPIYNPKNYLSCTDKDSPAPGVKGKDSWCVRNFDENLPDYLKGDRCAEVILGDDGQLFVNPGYVNNHFQVCVKTGYFYQGVLGINDDHVVEFECPSPQAVRQEQNLRQILNNTKNQTADDSDSK